MHPGQSAPARRRYLDNLKVVLVAGVITAHAFITYGDIGSWAYRETSSNDAFLIVAALAVSLGSLFAMGMFFLIAGLLTPHALTRKGTGGFLRDRMLRFGVVFLAYLVIYPILDYVGGGGEDTLGEEFAVQSHRLDPGPLWFVLVLLLFSIAYAAWRRLRPASGRERALRPGYLGWLVAAIAVSNVLVRLWLPINSYQLFAIHLWQWPQCAGLFILGDAAAEHGWLDPVPGRMRRVAGFAARAASLVMVGAFAVSRDSLDPFAGGLTWQAILTASCEASIAVALSVWLLGVFHQHVDHAGPLASGLGRAAFGAYVLQAPVLVGIALAASRLAWAPEVKFLLVAPAAVMVSFGLAWLLTRLPVVNRIL